YPAGGIHAASARYHSKRRHDQLPGRCSTAGQREASAMNTNARSIVSAALLGLVAIGTSACGSLSSPAITPSQSTTTVMPGCDHWFKLEWSTEREPRGEARIPALHHHAIR